MNIHESGEMYLETILILSKKSGHVRAIDVCETMGFSKPSVSRALGLLRSGGFIIVDNAGNITLTGEGRIVAERIYDRHQTLTAFLICLGVEEQTASADACKIEHDISDEAFVKIQDFVRGQGQ